MNSFKIIIRYTVWFYIIFLGLIAFNYQIFAQCSNESPKNWYCDKRLKLELHTGIVEEVTPFRKNDRNQSIVKFVNEGIEFETVNVVKFRTVEFDTGERTSNEIEYFNVRTKDNAAKEFQIGEKYVFETDWLGVGGYGKKSFEYKLNFIRPNNFVKLYSEANEEIELFRRFEKFDFFEEILGVGKNEAIEIGVIAGNAISLPNPVFPIKDLTLKNPESVKVLVLIGEDGNIIKAKAICTEFPKLAAAAEQAALRAKFRPTMRGGKAVKVKGFIIYNFAG